MMSFTADEDPVGVGRIDGGNRAEFTVTNAPPKSFKIDQCAPPSSERDTVGPPAA